MSRTVDKGAQMAYDQKSYETLTGGQMQFNETHVNKLNADIARLTRDRANLLDEVVKAHAEIERLKAALVRQGVATMDAEKEANTLRARAEELEVKALDKVWEVEKERDTLAEQLALSRLERAKEADDLRTQLAEVLDGGLIHRLRTELADKCRFWSEQCNLRERRLTEVEQQLAEEKTEVRELNKRLEEAQDTEDSLHVQLAAANEKLHHAEMSIQEMTDRLGVQPPAPTIVKTDEYSQLCIQFREVAKRYYELDTKLKVFEGGEE